MTKILRKVLAFTLVVYSPVQAQAAAKNVTVAEFKKSHPGATVIALTPEHFAQIQQQYLLAKNDKVPAKKKDPYTPSSDYDCSSSGQMESAQSSDGSSHLGLNLQGGYGSSDGEGFLIFVAVVGVLVVASLVVYSVGYLLRAGSYGLRCRRPSQLAFRQTWITDQSERQESDGTLLGFSYTINYQIPIGVMGLTLELGHFDMELTLAGQTVKNSYDGPYFLVGPSFRLPFGRIDGDAFITELLVGTTSDKDIGVMSTLRLGLDFRVTSRANFNIVIGASSIDVKSTKGIANNVDELNLLYGAGLGYQY